MKKTLLFIFVALSCFSGFAQEVYEKDAGYDTREILSPLASALDFNLTFTDGTTANLFNTCTAGNSVLLDFFYTTCGYCQTYAPTIDQAYVAHGSGSGNIKFWGIDYGDTDAQVIAYKSTYGVTNPCASGANGGGNAVCGAYSSSSSWTWTGYPTYSVVCPDKTYTHDVNYPPSATGFNTYFAACGTTDAFDKDNNPLRTVITFMYPLPANDLLNAHIYIDNSSQISVKLFDMMGKTVFSYSSDVTPGFYNTAIDVSGLPSGSYIIQLSQNTSVMDTQKIMVVR